jgi:hypothetical protein
MVQGVPLTDPLISHGGIFANGSEIVGGIALTSDLLASRTTGKGILRLQSNAGMH